MIVTMKNVLLLALEKEKLAALRELRKAGVMHIKDSFLKESGDRSSLEKKRRDAERMLVLLSSFPAKGEDGSEERSAQEILEEALSLAEEKELLAGKLEKVLREKEALLPWGDFRPDDVKALEKRGIHIFFCSCTAREFRRLSLPEGAVVSPVGKAGGNLLFAVVTKDVVPEEGALPLVPSLPEKPLSLLQEEERNLREKIREKEERLSQLARWAKKIASYGKSLASEQEFLAARDCMLSSGTVCCIAGYVPVTELAKVEKLAKDHSWGLCVEDVDESDQSVPTCIQKPAWLKIIDPLFDFIGITPGYRETDVSFFFLLAFPVFFGLLIGDAAYGTMFLVTAFLCKYLFRNRPKARLPLNLLILLSVFSILWGLITGNCLGLPKEKLPFFLQGLDFFARPTQSPLARAIAEKYALKMDDGELTNRFTQFLCFFIAALHLRSRGTG